MAGQRKKHPSIFLRLPWFLLMPRPWPLALLLERLRQAAPVRFAAATVIVPASEFGRAAMDELHQQTVNLLSFQSLPRAVYDAQAAYNLWRRGRKRQSQPRHAGGAHPPPL